MRTAGIKASLTPLERLDGFIQEQKARREEFWSRHRQRAGLQSTAVQSNAAPSGPQCETSGAPVVKEQKKERTRHWNPTNCVELEVHALKAIANREDAIRKLAAACAKVDEHVHLRSGFILSSDPLLRLFFSLVERVRERTVDAVECVASWERNVGRGQSFMYKGQAYLPNIGEDLKSLDVYTFIRSRFQKNSSGIAQESCSDDPFLCALTPHGIPVEPTSSFTVRQGGRMDQKGLRLRSAVRLVEPRITSASLLTRLDPEPGKLPPLRARGRSTTRKGAHGLKPRAVTHRDSTRTSPSSIKQPQKPSGPEDLHLPSLMDEKPPGRSSTAMMHVHHAEVSERLAEASKSLSGEFQAKSKRRSVCSAPPSRGGTSSRDRKRTSDDACPGSQKGNSALEHDSPAHTHTDDVKQQDVDVDDGGRSDNAGAIEEHAADAAPDMLPTECAVAEDQWQVLLVSGSCQAQLDETVGDETSFEKQCSEGISATSTLEAKLHVRTRVRVKCTPHVVVNPILNVVRQATSDKPEASQSEHKDTQILPADDAHAFTLGGITAQTFEIDDSVIVIGEGAAMRTAAAADANETLTSTVPHLSDQLTVKLNVSDSGTVSTTLAVTSQPDAPSLQSAGVHSSEWVSLSIAPAAEGEQQVLVSLKVVQQERTQHQQQSTSHLDPGEEQLETDAQECATEQLQSAQQWLEGQPQGNNTLSDSSQRVNVSLARVDLTLQSIEVCFVTLEVIEEAVLALTEIPVLPSRSQLGHDSKGAALELYPEHSADASSSPKHPEHSTEGATTPARRQSQHQAVDSEDSLAVDEAIDDLITTVAIFGEESASIAHQSYEQPVGSVCSASDQEHSGRNSSVSLMGLDTAGSSVGTLTAPVDQELEGSAVAERLTVKLMVMEGTGRVHVAISSANSSDAQSPLETVVSHLPETQISQDSGKVAVGLGVLDNGSVSATLRSKELEDCAQTEHKIVEDSHKHVSAQLLVTASDDGPFVRLTLVA